MKINLIIFLCVFYSSLGVLNTQSKIPVPKLEKTYKYLPELMIKDSVFLHGIDSLIFNSFCPEIKKREHKTFNIDCRKNENKYDLYFALLPTIQFHNESKLQGCFKYKNYLFIWYGEIPYRLWNISNNKRKLYYLKNLPFIRSDLAEFSFEYTQGKMELTGMCCF
ncbi:MAG: hypothetical protein DBY16_08040 [Coprobacter sp.]|jgi:hypothetical protein|nr:hypothetical protein [Barnesiella sp. GGCC_0306]MBS7039415.1 hypothetical protein [Bacteroidales bacterium]PWM90533.1 MAG: hypothetical protein DBY16_08040 [Coprobacter sp.]